MPSQTLANNTGVTFGVEGFFSQRTTWNSWLAWISAAFFIPSLALACGVWSSSSKVFEIIYISLWYIGPLNKVDAVDYLGAHSNGNVLFFLPFSIALIVAAFIGRARQLQN